MGGTLTEQRRVSDEGPMGRKILLYGTNHTDEGNVSIWLASRLRHWCSSIYLRILPLHMEFHLPLQYSSYTVSYALLG